MPKIEFEASKQAKTVAEFVESILVPNSIFNK